MLIDAGPMIALCDPRQPRHKACRDVLAANTGLITTWPCLTEAMHLVHRLGGHPLQQHLWTLFDRGFLRLHPQSDDDRLQMSALMARYHNVPMDLADASLVVLAHTLRDPEILTLDSDFRIYRLTNGQTLTILPE